MTKKEIIEHIQNKTNVLLEAVKSKELVYGPNSEDAKIAREKWWLVESLAIDIKY